MIQFGKPTRWLFVLTYLFLPLNIVGVLASLTYLAACNELSVGSAVLPIVSALMLCFAAYGLISRQQWAIKLLMAMFVIQLLVTPFKIHAKKLGAYDLHRSIASYATREYGYAEDYMPTRPKVTDAQNVFTFFFMGIVWTLPNLIYLWRRNEKWEDETLTGEVEQIPVASFVSVDEDIPVAKFAQDSE